ncbi:hypothetical protein ACFPES_01965 [Paenibacillus sp. GCM10023248]|nr:hypothetical protein [Bacillus sp. 3255]MDD9265789.1 hypothetical protein [Paenibacillus sp. MAHUQ-63]
MFRLKPDTPLSFAVQWAEKTHDAHRTLPGFRGITFLGEVITSEFGSISFWESREDAFAAGETLSAKVYSSAERAYIESPPIVTVYEVYNHPAETLTGSYP